MLSTGSNQWATRPQDERFWSLSELHEATRKFRAEAKTAHVTPSNLRLEAHDGNVLLVGNVSGKQAELTNYSFGQLARLGGAPAGYLQELPATLATQCANYALKKRAAENDAALNLLFRVNGAMELRAANSESYGRIWNEEIASRLLALESQGWKVPPAMPAPVDGVQTRIATADDCGEYTLVQPGQAISPSGLYASDRDMFAFLIHPDRVINAGGGRSLFRGFFCWNSEVGDKSFGIQTFLFDYICYNHNVWGAEQITEVRLRHVGQAVTGRMERAFQVEVSKFMDASAIDAEHRIKNARLFRLGGTKDEVLDSLFSMKAIGLPRKTLTAGYEAAEARVEAYGDPRCAWAMSQGLTEVSQASRYASERVAVDRAAGRVMELSF